MNRYLLSILFLLLIGLISCQDNSEKMKMKKEMDGLMEEYVVGYKAFNIPELELSYIENLKNISPLDSISTQVAFFQSIQEKLKNIDRDELDANYQSDYKTLEFEIALHLERLDLEENFWSIQNDRPLNEKKLYFILNGKNWYRYYIKRWIGAVVAPQELERIGYAEIEKIQNAILKIQRDLGFGEDRIGFYEHLNKKGFYEKKPRLIQAQFEERQAKVREHIWEQFNKWDLPVEKINQGNDSQLSQVPGFYDTEDQTFYFNLFDQPYNVRSMDWLYLHEANPGHHFQMNFENKLLDSLPAYRKLIPFSGYREGWGAYAEEIGQEVGLYNGLYDLMGKHEWDLVRSVRMILDVKLNFYGWSDEKALTFWKDNIDNQDDIAIREIERMKKWPVQIHTYKYGAIVILRLKKEMQKKEGKDFDIKKFHDLILGYGSLHWEALRERVLSN